MHRLGVGLILASLAASWSSGTALANDGAASNACPFEMAVTVELGKRSITIPQSALLPGGAGTDIDGYELHPDHAMLMLELVGSRGDVWRVPMTKLVRGKRCQGIFLGRPVQIAVKE